MGPFYRLRNAARDFAFTFENPIIFHIHNIIYLVDEPWNNLKHLIRDSYRQYLLSQATLQKHDCQGKNAPMHIKQTRSLYLSQTQTLHQTLLRQILTGSIDHISRPFKSNLTNGSLCAFSNSFDATAKHIFGIVHDVILYELITPNCLNSFTL